MAWGTAPIKVKCFFFNFNNVFMFVFVLLRVVVLDKVTDFLLFIGKLTITLGMGKFTLTRSNH